MTKTAGNPQIQTPDWVKNAIFYQIFPDRFARSPRTPHPRGIQFKAWGSPPEEQGYQGGDLYGVVDKLDYLRNLGITALYLNPIFSSASNHRYHTFDFMQVDPLLGGNAAFRALLDEAHARNIRVMLDGVFNHASRGFWPFHHILENGPASPYIDWFTIHDWPLRPYSSDAHHPPNYAAWWGLPGLPKLNTNNPGVRDYLFEVTRYWLEFGIDGWRLDVPNEINDEGFWRTFRRVVKETNPEAYIVGEIWGEAKHWLQGDTFDATMNYPFMGAALSFFGAGTLRPDHKRPDISFQPLDAPAFANRINEMHGWYDWEINHVQLNLLNSHDTARALWIMGEDVSALRLCVLFQMTMPGTPCIYYGDEVGLSSAGDPYCRAAFPWHETETWNQPLLQFYQKVTALRHQYPALRTGSFQTLYAEGSCYAFQRRLGQQTVVVCFNVSNTLQTVVLSVDALSSLKPIWSVSSHYTLHDGRLTLTVPARNALVLVS